MRQREAHVTELREQHKNHRHNFGRIQDDIQDAERKLRAKEEPIKRQRVSIQQAEAQLQSLSRDRGQHEGGFHEKMPLLLRAINQASGSFSHLPIGPLGNHVRLLNPKWSSVLENSFGTTLSSFVVTSKRDMTTLSGIMERVGWSVQKFLCVSVFKECLAEFN